jgi:hypothetical protein
MSPLRWALSIIGYPLGSLAAVQVASTTDGPALAAVAGLIAGLILGTAQWLALRPAVSWRWVVATAAGLSVGTALGAVVTGGADGVGSLVLYGAVAGAFVGVAQGLVLGARRILPWALTVAGSWAIAWIVTKAVIVDEQKGFVTFGLSGAAIATLATGLALRAFLGARRSSAAPVAAVAA